MIQEDTFAKPKDWPCNRLEQVIELVDRTYCEFNKNPNYRTREALVSATSLYDFNQLSSIGRFRITPYEIRLLNTFWMSARWYNVSSLLLFVYLVVSELCLMDRMIDIMRDGLCAQGMKYPPEDWKSYEYLHKPLLLFYHAYDDYRSRKEGGFDKSVINVTNRVLQRMDSEELLFDIAKSLTVMLSDLSCMMGSKREGMMRLSRAELKNILSFEFDLLYRSGQNPVERPLSGQLMIQISNYILKSRHGYNEDYICKYIEKDIVNQSLRNEDVWIREIRGLNDSKEGEVLRKLFTDTNWTGYHWVENIDVSDVRKYYVACFSKSKSNDEAAKRYGPCILGYKGDRILDLIAPICLRTMYRDPKVDKSLPETITHYSQTQVVAFDVLYDEKEAKEELRYLCSIIDLFKATGEEKRQFLQDILQYWLYSIKVSDPKWVAEKERRYVLFTYPEWEYKDTVLEDGFFKCKSTLYMFPDFVLGNADLPAIFKSRIDEKRRAVSPSSYFLCHDCLNRDFDLPNLKHDKCPICGSNNYEIVDG